MKEDIKKLEGFALEYAKKELSDDAIAAEFIGKSGTTLYFEPRYKPSLVSSTGDIHLITFKGGEFGVTYSREEIEQVNEKLF